MNEARVILLLISSSFLASDYCWDVETKRAVERHDKDEATVIPVILRPCDWHGAPFARLQGLPKDAKPVTTWANRDEAWTDVARGIRRAVQELTSNSQSIPPFEGSSGKKGESRQRSMTMGSLGERVKLIDKTLYDTISDRQWHEKKAYKSDVGQMDYDDSWITMQTVAAISKWLLRSQTTQNLEYLVASLENRFLAEDYDMESASWTYGTLEQPNVIPALWGSISVSYLYQNHNRLKLDRRLRRLWKKFQEGLKHFRRTDYYGWGMLAKQASASQYSNYTTALALLAMLESGKCGLPWESAHHTHNELIVGTARFLEARYNENKRGWFEFDENDRHAGLIFQIATTLSLVEESQLGFRITRDVILDSVVEDISSKNPLKSTENSVEAYTLLRVSGTPKAGFAQPVPIRFLVKPWAIACSRLWLRSRANQSSIKQKVLIEEFLVEQILNNSEEITNSLRSYKTYGASEMLFCLSDFEGDLL